MLLVLGGVLLGTAPLADVISRSPLWFALAGVATFAGVVLLVYGCRPITAAIWSAWHEDLDEQASEAPGDVSPHGRRRMPRPARAVGYLIVVINLPVLVTIVTGRASTLTVMDLALGVGLASVCFGVDQWLVRRRPARDSSRDRSLGEQ